MARNRLAGAIAKRPDDYRDRITAYLEEVGYPLSAIEGALGAKLVKWTPEQIATVVRTLTAHKDGILSDLDSVYRPQSTVEATPHQSSQEPRQATTPPHAATTAPDDDASAAGEAPGAGKRHVEVKGHWNGEPVKAIGKVIRAAIADNPEAAAAKMDEALFAYCAEQELWPEEILASCVPSDGDHDPKTGEVDEGHDGPAADTDTDVQGARRADRFYREAAVAADPPTPAAPAADPPVYVVVNAGGVVVGTKTNPELALGMLENMRQRETDPNFAANLLAGNKAVLTRIAAISDEYDERVRALYPEPPEE